MNDELLPLLLLDVDGVLNAVSRSGDQSVWSDWRSGIARAGDEDWPILFSPTVSTAVRRWHTHGLAEVRWLADWGDDANGELRELLDLPRFEVVKATAGPIADLLGDPAESASAKTLLGRWWKFDAVLQLVHSEPDRPIVWLDDDLQFERQAQLWMRDHTTSLLVAPPLHLVESAPVAYR